MINFEEKRMEISDVKVGNSRPAYRGGGSPAEYEIRLHKADYLY